MNPTKTEARTQEKTGARVAGAGSSPEAPRGASSVKAPPSAAATTNPGQQSPKAVEAGQIKPHLPVVCSENGQFAVVDHMEGPDTIKLQKDKSGNHHYMPLSWVVFVDDKVHVDRPGGQAMREWSSTPPRRT